MMKLSYVSQVEKNRKTRQNIYVSKKTSRLIDGSYPSIYHGRSMNFDELREYHPGDEVRDIDWKASARSQNTLVRQYIAERKHNIMFVFDTSKRMQGEAPCGATKSELGWLSAGTIASFAQKNGDYISAIYGKEEGLQMHPFHTDLYHLEMILASYDHDCRLENHVELKQVLEHILRECNRKMILFVVTDLKGMSSIPASLMRKLEIKNDLLFIVIDDADFSGKCVYNVELSSYLPAFFTKNKKLVALEAEKKANLIAECEERLHQNAIQYVIVDQKSEIEMKMIELLEMHRSER